MKTLFRLLRLIPLMMLLVASWPLPAMAGTRSAEPVGAVPAEGASAQQSHPSGAAMAADALIVKPARMTFSRPLGQFKEHHR